MTVMRGPLKSASTAAPEPSAVHREPGWNRCGCRLSLLVFLVSACGSAGSGDPTNSDIEGSGVPVSVQSGDADRLVVRSALGSVHVLGQPERSSVEVIAVRSGEGEGASRLDSGYSFFAQSSRLVVEVPEPGEAEPAGIDLFIRTPELLEVEVTAVQGLVELDGTLGGGHVETELGDALGTGLFGDFAVVVGSGTVEFDLDLGPNGSFFADVGFGPIRLLLPIDTSAQLEATTSSGDISIENLEFAGANLDGRASGVLGGGLGILDLTTGSGDIDLVGQNLP